MTSFFMYIKMIASANFPKQIERLQIHLHTGLEMFSGAKIPEVLPQSVEQHGY